MNRYAGLVAAGLLVALAAFPARAQLSAMAALEALGSALRSAPAWQADYRQEYIPAGMSSGEVLTGHVEIAWPHNALFHTGDPVIQKMGLERRSVRLIDLEMASCDQHLLDDEEWSRIPLAAVLDPSTALDHFTVLEHGERGFELVPREAAGVDRVEVLLGADNLPIEVIIVDPQGATNRLQFEDWQPMTNPPASWLPDPPSGVDCVAN
jgi:hypothetical protein